MIYDDVTGEYRPRWGYKAVNNGIEDHAIVEVKTGQDPFADPWAEQKQEKKMKVEKNAKKQIKNLMRGKDGKVSKASYGNDVSSSLLYMIINITPTRHRWTQT